MFAGVRVRSFWAIVLMAIAIGGAQFVSTPASGPTVAAAQEGEGEAASGETASQEKKEEEAPKSFLAWTFNSLGIRYTVAFLAMSFALVAVFIMNLINIRREQFAPPALVEPFEQSLNEKKWQEAYDMAKADQSFLGQMLAAGLEKLQSGYPQAIEAMQEVGEEENMKAEHRLSYIALIGTLAPMVGLLGTVDGMIAAFAKIADAKAAAPKPHELAEGISTALVTTAVGLLLAIPAIAAFNLMKNRLAQLVLESGILGERLMSRVNEKK